MIIYLSSGIHEILEKEIQMFNISPDVRQIAPKACYDPAVIEDRDRNAENMMTVRTYDVLSRPYPLQFREQVRKGLHFGPVITRQPRFGHHLLYALMIIMSEDHSSSHCLVQRDIVLCLSYHLMISIGGMDQKKKKKR